MRRLLVLVLLCLFCLGSIEGCNSAGKDEEKPTAPKRGRRVPDPKGVN
jgi:hypothetical protein